MADFKIITDTTADLPKEYLDRQNRDSLYCGWDRIWNRAGDGCEGILCQNAGGNDANHFTGESGSGEELSERVSEGGQAASGPRFFFWAERYM